MRVKDKLQMLGVRPVKQRGQNFVIDPTLIAMILEFGRPQVDDNLIEIGPGLGALTSTLSKHQKLTVVEIEESFCDDLRRRFPNITIINDDIRAVDLSTFGSRLVVFGNLPYSLSTDIIFYLISFAPFVERAVFLLQKEFVERLAAQPCTRAYGALTVGCRLWCDVRTGPVVPGSSFHPPTKVDSQLIELSFFAKPRVEIGDPLWFQRVVQAAFSRRRKKLINSLRGSAICSAEKIEAALADAGIDGNRRAETLSIEEFWALSEVLRRP